MKYKWAQPQTIEPQPVEKTVADEVTDDVPDCYKGEAVILQQRAEAETEANVEQVLGRITPDIAIEVIRRGDMSIEGLKKNLKEVTRERLDELKRRK